MRVFLIGFMGAGKSYWGQIWASKYGYSFYDLDVLIENVEKKSISSIFEEKGEMYFRKLESDVLKKTVSCHNCIIACGGGTACFSDNIKWMNSNGVTVFINQNIENIFTNLQQDNVQRPLLLNKNSEEQLLFIQQKLEERMPYYKQAQFTLMPNELYEDSLSIILK